MYQRYKTLDRDGICQVGEIMESGGIMVNKLTPSNAVSNDLSDTVGLGAAGGAVGTGTATGTAGPQPTSTAPAAPRYKGTPLVYKGPAPCTVDKVVITSNESENFIVKVSIALSL